MPDRAAAHFSVGDLEASAGALALALTAWFRLHQRDLPWRKERTPYRVWLSEIMLQQTQVATVVPYFHRFLERFEDITDLAHADVDEVLALWSGLGYYRRGRNLHRAAGQVAALGGFPDTLEGLKALAGVGDYTAGAIASFAFGLRVPIVDGNVQRVLSRLFADWRPVNAPEGLGAAWERARLLVDAAEDPSKLNEGLMELGAMVCTPKAPSCDACPWTDACRAHHTDTAEELPIKVKKAARKPLDVAAVLVTREGSIWLERTEGEGLFGGLWAPPVQHLEEGADVSQRWRQLLRERSLSPPDCFEPAIVVRRTLSHRDLTFRAARLDVRADPSCEGRWVSLSALDGVGTSTAVRTLLRAAGL